jgi:hypothetical protein
LIQNRTMRTYATPGVERLGETERARLIRQASAWLPHRPPEPLPLQDLEQSEAIRWVDIYGEGLQRNEVIALLNPICSGHLSDRMARDLITPERFAAGGSYRNSDVRITSTFRVRHLHRDPDGNGAGKITSIFEPVQLLIGDDWLVSCWHPSRVFRGLDEAAHDGEESSNGLYLAVAERWPTVRATGASDLAAVIQRELAMANGYRNSPS